MSGIEVNIDIVLQCVCGHILEGTAAGFNTFSPTFRVTPCPECVRKARSRGYNEGYEAREGA